MLRLDRVKYITQAGGLIQIRGAVVRHKEGKPRYKFKPKNWYRKREIPITKRLRQLIDRSVAASNGVRMFEFANDIPVNQFVLTMLDETPFSYDSFRKTVWDKAITEAGIAKKFPYASRHTFVQWALLVGVVKTRLVDLCVGWKKWTPRSGKRNGWRCLDNKGS